MIRVEQTEFFRPERHPLGASRGNCLAACVASVFGVPITQCLEVSAGSQDVMGWTKAAYPGLRCEHRQLRKLPDEPETLDDWRGWPSVGSVHNPGFWIAGVYSFRIPDVMMRGCGCADTVPGGDPRCRWCHGRPQSREMGVLWGLHTVVMHDWDLVWDPHPRRADGVGPLSASFTWRVVDPSML